MGFVDYTVCSSLESNEPDAFICFLAVQTISIYRQNSRGACVAFNCDHNSDIASLGHGLNLGEKKWKIAGVLGLRMGKRYACVASCIRGNIVCGSCGFWS